MISFGRKGVVASLVVLASSAGCATTSTNCLLVAKPALVVTVVDAAGTRVCDASVTAIDGSFTAVLSAGPSCQYVGLPERAGSYSLKVRSGSRTKTLDGLQVTKDECHVRPLSPTVTLDQ